MEIKNLSLEYLVHIKSLRKFLPFHKLDLPKDIRIHPVIHISEFEPFYEDRFGRKKEPPPVIIDNEEEY